MFRRLLPFDAYPRRWVPRRRSEARPFEARDLESGELDGVLGPDQYMLGGEGTVNEREIVGRLEAVGNLKGHSQRALDGQRPLLANPVSQASPVEGLHHDEGAAIGSA